MDSLNKLVKSIRPTGKNASETLLLNISYGIFALAALYIFYRGQIATIGLAIGVAFIVYAITNGMLAVSLIAGALCGLIAVHYSRKHVEGFYGEDEEEEDEIEMEVDEGFENPEEEAAADEDEEVEEFEDAKKPVKAAPKKKKKAPAPDHGSRAEAFQLGKKYKKIRAK